MKIKAKEKRLLKRALSEWAESEFLSEQQRDQCEKSIEVAGFDWHRFAQYMLWAALLSLAISLVSLVLDDWLMALIKRIFNATELSKAAVSGGFGLSLLMGAKYFAKLSPRQRLTFETLIVISAMFLSTSAYFGIQSFYGELMIRPYVLLLVLLYAAMSYVFGSQILWSTTLVMLTVLFALNLSDVERGFLPSFATSVALRLVLLGGLVTVLSFWQTSHRTLGFQLISRHFSAVLALVALWVMSFTGLSEDTSLFGTLELWPWWVVAVGVAFMVLVAGLKCHDSVLSQVGILFVLLNIYTRFIELAWFHWSKTVFFAVLGLSLWAIGHFSERLWLIQSKPKARAETTNGRP
ncbi:hypothetical protein [Echinimonas agarilytica]|uniref:DUF2157 domain-containing protein n=1 Tax=Echinimonas agarilytica TaxID=1215918 RepID=A0AA41W4R1_9GAMM|nr:hypothetical protein [Echinimonas agarilytica]MCM2678927.1 hypothetical protein [Echinimonas agarilytica]